MLCARPDCDAYVYGKAESDHAVSENLQAHIIVLVFMDIELSIKAIHSPRVKKYQCNEYVNGPLLGEPETQFEPTEADSI